MHVYITYIRTFAAFFIRSFYTQVKLFLTSWGAMTKNPFRSFENECAAYCIIILNKVRWIDVFFLSVSDKKTTNIFSFISIDAVATGSIISNATNSHYRSCGAQETRLVFFHLSCTEVCQYWNYVPVYINNNNKLELFVRFIIIIAITRISH